MRRAQILYSSPVFPEPNVVKVPSHTNSRQVGRVWVRYEYVEAPNLSEALALAKPHEGETVLNSVWAD